MGKTYEVHVVYATGAETTFEHVVKHEFVGANTAAIQLTFENNDAIILPMRLIDGVGLRAEDSGTHSQANFPEEY